MKSTKPHFPSTLISKGKFKRTNAISAVVGNMEKREKTQK